MNAADLVLLLQRKNIGPRVEIVLGEAVLIDLNLTTKWRVEQEDGAVEYFDSKPRYDARKTWPKIEQVTCAEIKTGAAPKINPATRGLGAS